MNAAPFPGGAFESYGAALDFGERFDDGQADACSAFVRCSGLIESFEYVWLFVVWYSWAVVGNGYSDILILLRGRECNLSASWSVFNGIA